MELTEPLSILVLTRDEAEAYRRINEILSRDEKHINFHTHSGLPRHASLELLMKMLDAGVLEWYGSRPYNHVQLNPGYSLFEIAERRA